LNLGLFHVFILASARFLGGSLRFSKKLEPVKKKEEPLVTLATSAHGRKNQLEVFIKLKEKLQTEYVKKNVVLVEEAGEPRWISVRYPKGGVTKVVFIRAEENRITISGRETECMKISKLAERILKSKFKMVERLD
jgi:hypothetical protein